MALEVLVVGCGAVGSFYSEALYRQGAAITVVTRSPKSFPKEIYIHSKTQCYLFKPKACFSYEELAKSNKLFDVALVCSKVLEPMTMVRSMSPFLKRVGCPVVLIQNGYGIEIPWLTEYKQLKLWRALAFVCVHKSSKIDCVHQDYGHLTIGSVNSTEPTPDVLSLCDLWQACGIAVHMSKNIKENVWKKQCWNVPFNGLSVTQGLLNTKELLQCSKTMQHIQHIMQEVATLARFDGVELDQAFQLNLIEKTHRMIPYNTSMCLDAIHQRKLELDAVYYSIQSFAKRYNCNIPFIDKLVDRLTELNVSFS